MAVTQQSMSDGDDAVLRRLAERVVESYRVDEATRHLDANFLPGRDRIIEIIELMRRLIFPGFFDEKRLTSATIHGHAAKLVDQVHSAMYEQVRQALRHETSRVHGKGKGDACDRCDVEARRVTLAFLERVPELRRIIATDVRAAFEGDPAAVSTTEIIFCYPGLDAVFTYRLAHELHNLKVPLLPRVMTEYAHNETGIDIHPGASIGESFFIDHGTGVVIGETSIIGDRVKIYQGVTLGALSTKGGQAWRGRKRHPTIEDDVTIYPNATILGGETVIGARCVINGSAFVIFSVPADHTVRVNHPKFELKARRNRGDKKEENEFQI